MKTKPIAVKYVEKHESFKETSLMSVKENFKWYVVHWGICHTSAILKYKNFKS